MAFARESVAYATAFVVLTAFVGLLAAGASVLPPNRALRIFLGYAALLTVALVVVCWLKGEPPRWRWGDDKDDKRAQH